MDKITKEKSKVQLQNWSIMAQRCRDSGKTVKEWCEENGINLKTYYYRLRKVRENMLIRYEEERQDIVPINNATVLEQVRPRGESSTSLIKLIKPDITVELPEGIDRVLLIEVLQALKC